MERYRGEIAKSSFSGSGSDQTRSAIGPSCGISERDDDGELAIETVKTQTSESINYLDLINGVY